MSESRPYPKRDAAIRYLAAVGVPSMHATEADIMQHGHGPVCCCLCESCRSDACDVNAQIIREQDAPRYGYRLEHSYDSPDHWLRCIEGDAKALIGYGADAWDAAADAMREHWQQEHGRGLKPQTSLRFGTAEVLPDGPRTPYVDQIPIAGED